jgi:hypothetical protein
MMNKTKGTAEPFSRLILVLTRAIHALLIIEAADKNGSEER